MTALAELTDLQLDALRELANIGSGNAGTALGAMLGTSVDISVPTAAALPLADAVAAVGDAGDLRYGVVVPVVGDLAATAVLLLPERDARTMCSVYGLEPGTADGASMLGEVGNIVGTSYITVLGQMVGWELEPAPPEVVRDMLAAILESVVLARGEDVETVLILDTALRVEDGDECALSFLLLPSGDGVLELLSRLGL